MTNFRPVALTEHAVFQGRVFVKQPRASMAAAVLEAGAVRASKGPSTAQPLPTAAASSTQPVSTCPLVEQRALSLSGDSKDGLSELVNEVVVEGHSCLVFCASRAATQVSALSPTPGHSCPDFSRIPPHIA